MKSRTTIQDNPKDHRHDTENGYTNLGCRCKKCTEAHRIYYINWLRQRDKKMPPCENCGEKPQYAKGKCKRCTEYKRRTKREWVPEGLWGRKVKANDDTNDEKHRGVVSRIILGKLRTPRKRAS